ncbi:MAG: protein translocase subunit SecD [Candidatus Bipolaricaulota bacterium]
MVHHSMTRNDWLRLASVALILIAAAVLVAYPPRPLKDIVKLGLDLQGGVRLVLEGEGVAEMPADEQTETIGRMIEILSNRIDQYGLTNAEIRRFSTDRILVSIPGATDPEDARRLIGQTAVLEFRRAVQVGQTPLDDLSPSSSNEELLYTREGVPVVVEREVLLTGAALANATVQTSQDIREIGQLQVRLSFSQEGAEQFASVVRELGVGEFLAVILDGTVYSAPMLQESIVTAAGQGWREVQDSTVISGGKMTRDDARILAAVLRAGALPVSVRIAEEVTIGPSLGSDSIRRGLMALAIGFSLILVYMMLYYRRLGIVANLALLLNMVFIGTGLILTRAVLTLPGIAGVILTIGTAVDSNIIIFERVKEERRTGKPPLASVRAGYERSLAVLVDANVTTLITAAILLFLGTGPVRGFAITLAIGVVGTVYCALVATRLMLEKGGFYRFIPVRLQKGGE